MSAASTPCWEFAICDQETYVKRYIRALYEAIRAGDLQRAQSVWQGKFEKAVERFVSAIDGKEIDGGVRSTGQEEP